MIYKILNNRNYVIILFVVCFFGFFLLNSQLKSFSPDYVLPSSMVRSKNFKEFVIFVFQVVCLFGAVFTSGLLLPGYKKELSILISSVFLFAWATTHIQIQMPNTVLPYVMVKKKNALVFFFNLLRIFSVIGVGLGIKLYFDSKKPVNNKP